jgi:glycosyltransferase involved in cell wall biosynthesis
LKEKINIIYIISLIDKANIFEWDANFLNKDKFILNFILLNPGPSELEKVLRESGIKATTIRYKNKAHSLSAFLRLWYELLINRPDIIHCHLYDASIIGLLAGKFSGVKKRIMTRHHALIHYDEHPSGRKWDRLCNQMATDLVAISRNVEEILSGRDKANPEKISLIYHGFHLPFFEKPDSIRIHNLESKYHLPANRYPVVGVISRFLEWKGVQFIIPAFEKLLAGFPHAHLILANSTGNYSYRIHELLGRLPASTYTEIPFENDIVALYNLFDIFIHVPTGRSAEAFGQIYIESLLAGVPSIFTLSGIANEFIIDRENALVVSYENPEEIYSAMLEILSDPSLRKKLIENGRISGTQFSIGNHLRSLEKLYLNE